MGLGLAKIMKVSFEVNFILVNHVIYLMLDLWKVIRLAKHLNFDFLLNPNLVGSEFSMPLPLDLLEMPLLLLEVACSHLST